MNGEPLRRQVTVTNPQGFHMRPMSEFVQVAGQFRSSIHVCRGEKRSNGKSMMELMLLAAEHGSELTLEARGEDADQALEKLAGLFNSPEGSTVLPEH